MPLADSQITAGIKDGFCVKAVIPSFENGNYYVDPEGYLYSMYNPSAPKEVPPKMGKGLMWVTLFTRDGKVTRRMIGDIVAATFLADIEHDSSENTVIYRDGNLRNNAASNLQWGTPLQQQTQIRDTQTFGEEPTHSASPLVDEALSALVNGAAKPEAAAVPFEIDKDENPMLVQLHALQERLERAESRSTQLARAMQPFAAFNLSPAHASATGNTVVLQSNKGQSRESVLTVHDFRVAEEVLKNS